MEELKKKKIGEVEGVQVKEASKKSQSVVYVIKDLDLEASIADVKDGIRMLIVEEEFTVSPLRPAFAGTQHTTVIIPGRSANKLKDVTRVQIDWIRCRLERREADTRCYRCWEMGYTASTCKGEDRRKRCFNCGQEVHYWANCTQGTKCLGCGSEGQKTGNLRCPNKK